EIGNAARPYAHLASLHRHHPGGRARVCALVFPRWPDARHGCGSLEPGPYLATLAVIVIGTSLAQWLRVEPMLARAEPSSPRGEGSQCWRGQNPPRRESRALAHR